MSLRNLSLKRSYETTSDRSHLLDIFYIPVLENTKRYYRIAGYFSSSALIVASEGIEALIKNNGYMYLLISPELSKEDYDIISEHNCINEKCPIISNFKINPLNPDEHLQALAYLLDTGRLQIKIVVPSNKNASGIFHEKIGIFIDDNNDIVSFSGSINESAHGWVGNIEEFKVFCSWVPGQVDYLNDDLRKFSSYWKNDRKEIAQVYDLPDSVKREILKVVPNDIRNLKIMRRYQSFKEMTQYAFKPFLHQQQAIDMWIHNNYQLMMEMATGTGKTRTAIGCLMKKMKDDELLLTIISTPQNTLSRQWLTDFQELHVNLEKTMIADGTNHNWKKDMEFIILDLEQSRIKNAVIFTTHATSSSDAFINIVLRTKRKSKVLFICDEAHAIATSKQKNALLSNYEYRIGLTATPERLFDENGTKLLRSYFGNKSFEFSIYDALHTINEATGKPFLNAYEYHPIFVSLTDDEYIKYKRYSRQIATLMNSEDPDQEKLEKLLERRADILKDSKNKISVLEGVLISLHPEKITDALLFVSPTQIENVMEMLSHLRITRAKITEKESASKKVTEEGESERQKYILDFKNRYLQMLVAIKCLDEGIDIPSARIAFLLANGKNPREYIQRIGRVIRQAPGKQKSIIYDFIVYSPDDSYKRIIKKEYERARFIAQNATNYAEVKDAFRKMGVDINAD